MATSKKAAKTTAPAMADITPNARQRAAQRKAAKAEAQKAGVTLEPEAKGKGSQKPVKGEATTDVAKAEAEARAKEQAAKAAADKALHDEVREMGLTDEAAEITAEYMGILKKTTGLTNRLVEFACKCITMDHWLIAMEDAYTDLRNRRNSVVPEEIPQVFRNYKSIISWALKHDELRDEAGKVRTFSAIQKRKAEVLQAAKNKPVQVINPTTGGNAGHSDNALEEEYGTDNPDFIAIYDEIHRLEVMVADLVTASRSGDTLAPAKTVFLQKAVQHALEEYQAGLQSLVGGTAMADAMPNDRASLHVVDTGSKPATARRTRTARG